MTDKNVDINLLLKRLKDPNDEVREEAASGLVGVLDKRIVPALIKSLETDENPGVKYFIKKSLSLIQKEHGDIKKIVEELSNTDAAKAPAAAAAGPQAVIQAKAEDMPEDSRDAVNTILRRIKQKDETLVNEALEQLTAEEDPYIKATYISAIGRLGDQTNMADIISFLSDPDFRVIANTVEALERLGNPQCVEALVKLISHSDNRVRANVIKALWKFTASNLSINRHVIDKLKQMIESESADMCESAIFVLSEIADEEAIDILDKAAYGDNAEISAKASAALEKAKNTYAERKSQSSDETYIDGVIEKLSRGSADSSKGIDEATRAKIDEIQSYIDAGDKQKLPLVLKGLAAEKNPFIRATLVSAVGRLGGRTEMDALLPFIKDADARVVANVVQALESVGNPRCVEHIVKLVAHPDNRVRANTVKAIWKYAHTNVTANRIVLERLKEMMFSTKNQMRESAIFVLSEIGDDEAIDLLSIAANDKSPEIKSKAEAALANALKIRSEREQKASQQPVSEEEISRIPAAPPAQSVKNAETAPDEKIQPAADVEAQEAPAQDLQVQKHSAPASEKTPASLPGQLNADKTETKIAAEPAKIIDDAARREIDKIQAMIDAGDPSPLKELAARLSTEKNPFIKATLVSAVGKLGGRDNMEAVIGFLNDEDARVVANAAEALENLGNPKCVEELIKHINHNDNRVRANVVKAIWKYAQSNVSAGKVILARLKTMMFSSKAQMRESALYVLGEIASDEAMELISIAISDKVESVQQKAREAMERAEARRREKPVQTTRTQQAGAAQETVKKTQPQAAVQKTKSTQAAPASIKQAEPLKQPAGAPVRRISLFKLLFIMAFLLFLSVAGGFSIYWFVIEGKDYRELETAVKNIAAELQGAPAVKSGGVSEQPGASSPAESPASAEAAKAPAEPKKETFTVNDQIEIAKQYLNEGHFSESINSLAKLSAKHPQNADLKKVLLDSYFKRGQSLFNLEIYDAAKLDFDKIVSLDGGGGYSQKAQSYIDKISKFLKK